MARDGFGEIDRGARKDRKLLSRLKQGGKSTGSQTTSPGSSAHDGHTRSHSWSTICNVSSNDQKEFVDNESEDRELESVPKMIEAHRSDDLQGIGAWVSAVPLDAEYKSCTTQAEASSLPFGLRFDPQYPQELVIKEPAMQQRTADNLTALSTTSSSHRLQGTVDKQ